MKSTTDEVPAKRRYVEGREKTQIPQETMLVVLLWLDRFDLDGTLITTRRLCSLVQNNQMPLRKVYRVEYNGEHRLFERFNVPPSKSSLSIRAEEDETDERVKVELQIETEADARKAALYLSCCFVRTFSVFWHRDTLPKNTIIAAPALIRQLEFHRCDFAIGESDTLSETLNGSTFQSLAFDSPVPASQMDNRLLEVLRLRGCNQLQLRPYTMQDLEKYHVTEDGILAYCFTRDAHLPVPERRSLVITSVNIMPEFFKKIVEASKTSQLTCDVELCLDELQFEVDSLDLGVLPSRSSEYNEISDADVHHVRYDIADHGNGIRLLIHFVSEDDEEWEVIVRHGKKDHDEFFEPRPEEEEQD